MQYNKEKKKLIFFAYDFNFGGIEKALINLLDNLNYKKYDVTVVLEKKSGPLIDKVNKNVILKEYKLSTSKLIIWRKLYNFVKRLMWSIKNYKKYDFSCCYATYSLMGSKLSRIASKNSCIYVHSNYKNIYTNFIEFNNFFNKLSVKKFNKIIFVSNESEKDFISVYPTLEKKCFVLNNFINYNEILKLSKEKINEKKNDGTLFVYVGRLDERSKKITRIIELARYLADKNYQVKFLFVGSGLDKNRYLDLIHKYKIDSYVKFIGEKENPYPYINIADYIILTSEYEGFPVVYLESIVLRKKIITTIDVSDEYISIPNNYGYIVSKSINKMCVQVENILKKDNLKYKKIDISEMNEEKIKNLEKIIDGEKNDKI